MSCNRCANQAEAAMAAAGVPAGQTQATWAVGGLASSRCRNCGRFLSSRDPRCVNPRCKMRGHRQGEPRHRPPTEGQSTTDEARIAGEEPASDPTAAEATSAIIQDGVAAREALEEWLDAQEDEFPYLELDRTCESCVYTCKQQWRFHGMRGASGKLYTVGPMCPVLWRFNPRNRYARLIEQEAQISEDTDEL